MIRPMRGVAPKKELTDFPYYASPKIDGIRAIVMNGAVYSKTMKLIPNSCIQELFGKYHGLDGELTVGFPNNNNVYENSRGSIMTIKGDPTLDYRFNVFDRWDLHLTETKDRLQSLCDDYNEIFFEKKGVYFVGHKLVSTQEELIQAHDYAVANGFEGIMLRQINGLYKYGTSTEKEGFLLKIKHFAEAEARVIGFGEQLANTNQKVVQPDGLSKRSSAKQGKTGKNTLGFFIVNDVKTGKTFEIGGGPGITNEVRQEIWNNKANYLNRLLRYRYQEIGTQDLPRLPQFAGWRDEIDFEPEEGG